MQGSYIVIYAARFVNMFITGFYKAPIVEGFQNVMMARYQNRIFSRPSGPDLSFPKQLHRKRRWATR